MTDFAQLLKCLTTGNVEFTVIGGFAAAAHGSAHLTFDLDVVYRRTPENMLRLVRALEPLGPYLRGAPPGLPFRFDVPTIERGLNFALATSAGDLDLLGEATGGGTYDVLLPHSEVREVFDLECRFVNLEYFKARCTSTRGHPKWRVVRSTDLTSSWTLTTSQTATR